MQSSTPPVNKPELQTGLNLNTPCTRLDYTANNMAPCAQLTPPSGASLDTRAKKASGQSSQKCPASIFGTASFSPSYRTLKKAVAPRQANQQCTPNNHIVLGYKADEEAIMTSQGPKWDSSGTSIVDEETMPLRILTHQYVTSPFTEDYVLVAGVDFDWEATNGFHQSPTCFNYPCRTQLPTWMQRVIYAWRRGLISVNEEFAFDQGGFKVSKREALRMLQGYELSTEPIEGMMYIMHRFNQMAATRWAFVKVAHSDLIPTLDDNELHSKDFKYFTSCPLSLARWIFIPTKPGNHWLLFVIDLNENIFRVYNPTSLEEPWKEYVENMALMWKGFLRAHLSQHERLRMPIEWTSCPRQTKVTESGMYIMKSMDCLVGRRTGWFFEGEVQSDRGRAFHSFVTASYFKESFGES